MSTWPGLGPEHRRDRARLMRELLATGPWPCPYCGEPMVHPARCEAGPCHYCQLNRDHVVPRALGGGDGPARLAHTRCDSSFGSTLMHQLAGHKAGNPAGAWWLPG